VSSSSFSSSSAIFVCRVGGWGQKCNNPNANNPGCYRKDTLSSCFGILVVGEGFTITLNSSEAVEDYLPEGGTPDALNKSYTNPGPKVGINVLAGQLTALSLNVGFDTCDPEFSSSGSSLGDQVYCADGPCDGMTVFAILALGHQVLGGGTVPSPFTYSTLNDCLKPAYLCY
jgi:hypothetical protein